MSHLWYYSLHSHLWKFTKFKFQIITSQPWLWRRSSWSYRVDHLVGPTLGSHWSWDRGGSKDPIGANLDTKFEVNLIHLTPSSVVHKFVSVAQLKTSQIPVYFSQDTINISWCCRNIRSCSCADYTACIKSKGQFHWAKFVRENQTSSSPDYRRVNGASNCCCSMVS